MNKKLITTGQQTYTTNGQLPTHAYAHLLADVGFAVFAPAFASSLCDS